MIKKIATLLCSSLLLLTAKAQQQPKEKSSLLWEISGKDLKSPSWLYGTIHLLCPEDLHFSPATLNAVKQSTSVYLEIDMDDPQVMEQIQKGLMMPEGYSFKSLLPAEDYARIHKWCQDSLGLDIERLDRFKPLLLTSMITRQFFSNACKEPVACEAEFVKIAKEQQKPVYGLEQAADQIAIFDSIPDKEEAQMILRTIDDNEKTHELYRRMRGAYNAQDIAALSKLMNETEDIELYREILLDNRNRNWIGPITTAATKASTFFAVGAGHLGGSTGVIELLRKEGYTVKPVR